MVGDDDQTIYQWRGSSVENILKFEKRYPHVEQIRLEATFRSSEGVIETAREFIGQLTERLPKQMGFAEAQSYEVGDVVALSFASPEEETKYIADAIQSLQGTAFDDGDGERGLSYSNVAVLLRSVKNNGAVITEALKEANIPSIVSGLDNLFETEEACAARDLFYFIAGEPIGKQSLRKTWESANLGLRKRKLDSLVTRAFRVGSAA